MGTMGDGYGSECHLLRWMGRHRTEFNKRVLTAIGMRQARLLWQDFGFDAKITWPDAEIKGLDFLSAGNSARSRWLKEWPQTGNVQNWDAVGRIPLVNGKKEWLLVEAKAHLEELGSSCGATATTSLAKIQTFFATAKNDLGVHATADWMNDYYQYANRLATLAFLERHGVKARLLFVYFTGDSHPGWACPSSKAGWQPALRDMKTHLGLPKRHALSSRIHDLFLPVAL